MGNRLSKIVTRTGDAGTTGLGDGSRVAKDCLRIDVIGEIDELDALVASAVAEARPGDHLLVMSNGGFGGVHQKLLDALARR